MKKLVIADIRSMSTGGNAVGHYFTVAQNYLDLFKDICEVKIAGGPVYKNKFEKKDLLLLDYNAESNCSSIENKRRELCNLRQLFQLCENDVIIFQSSAVSTVYIGIALWAKKQDIYMIQYNTMSLDSTIKRFIYKTAKNKIKGMICPDDLIGKEYQIPYTVVTDYIYTGSQKEKNLIPLESKKYDFGFFGIITKDKGVLEVAQYFALKNYKVVIAGYPVDAELGEKLKKICQDKINIELRLQYLNEEEYIDGIRNCKYCILNYSGAYSEHSSGVIYDILFNGTPVVGTNCKALKSVAEFKAGYVYRNIEDIDLESLMDKKIYDEYCHNILSFKKAQDLYAQQIRSFVLKGKNHDCKTSI